MPDPMRALADAASSADLLASILRDAKPADGLHLHLSPNTIAGMIKLLTGMAEAASQVEAFTVKLEFQVAGARSLAKSA